MVLVINLLLHGRGQKGLKFLNLYYLGMILIDGKIIDILVGEFRGLLL
jgi:hypothetical protein